MKNYITINTSNPDTVVLAKCDKNGNPDLSFVFYVNEKKGTVICKKSNCRDDVRNYIKKKLPEISINSFPEKTISLKDNYIGKAKCHKMDKFILEDGMKYAQRRMLAKYYKDKYRVFCTITNDLRSNVLPEIDRVVNKYADRLEYFDLYQVSLYDML